MRPTSFSHREAAGPRAVSQFGRGLGYATKEHQAERRRIGSAHDALRQIEIESERQACFGTATRQYHGITDARARFRDPQDVEVAAAEIHD